MVKCTIVLLILFTCSSGVWCHNHHPEPGKQLMCYFGYWSSFREKAKFDVEDIEPCLCTTLIYAFLGVNETDFRVSILDPHYAIDGKGLEKFVALRNECPNLKVLAAVGGWAEGSIKFSNMANETTTRKIFIDSVVEFLREYKFDGISLDWQYPANRGGIRADKDNFVHLLKELREAFAEDGWMLTASVECEKVVIEDAYDIPNLSKHLDYIQLLAYNYHGKWDGRTGHNTPLYAREDEPEAEKHLNVHETVMAYLDGQAPAHKVVLGVAFYGRSFILSDENEHGMAAPSEFTAFSGPYTDSDGYLGYNEICELQSECGWEREWEEEQKVPYMYRKKQWIGYDDECSLREKVAYAKEKGLGGVMVWAVDMDDFSGSCSERKGQEGVKFPLLNALKTALAE